MEGFAVQIVERSGIGGELKGQLVGIQSLIVPVKPLVQLAVFAVPQQGVPGVGKLGANLMGSAGDQLTLHQRQPPGACQGFIIGLAGFGTGLGGVGDEHPVFFGILEQIPLEAPLSGLWRALHDGKIPLVQLPILDLLVHHPQSLGGLGGDDNPSGVPVNAVAQGWGEGVLLPGTPFLFLVQVGLDVVDKGTAVLRAVVGVDSQPRPLIRQQNVLVLVDDVQFGVGHGEEGVVLSGLVEKFVVDVKLQHIPGLQPGVPLHPGTVALDALDADVFLRQRGRQQRDGLRKKPIQPLPGIVGADGKFLHV